MTEPKPSTHESPTNAPDWVHIRADGSLGSLRRILDRVRAAPQSSSALLLISPGPRWVPEPHMESALASVLHADPGLAAAVAWWRWQDAPARGTSSNDRRAPATVRVGGRSGDDLTLVDLLARPMSVGPLALRPASISALESLRDLPADAVLDAASTWAIAIHLAASRSRVASLPRTCSTRTRTIVEDPESLRPIGLAWLVRLMLEQIGPGALHPHERRELLARWQAVPEITPRALAVPSAKGGE